MSEEVQKDLKKVSPNKEGDAVLDAPPPMPDMPDMPPPPGAMETEPVPAPPVAIPDTQEIAGLIEEIPVGTTQPPPPPLDPSEAMDLTAPPKAEDKPKAKKAKKAKKKKEKKEKKGKKGKKGKSGSETPAAKKGGDDEIEEDDIEEDIEDDIEEEEKPKKKKAKKEKKE